MIHYDEDNIQFFEKKYSIEEIVQLYKANRLLFVRQELMVIHRFIMTIILHN